MNLKDKNLALIVIDVQKGFQDEALLCKRNNPDAEKVCGKIINHWRKLNRPIFHIRHSSLDPNSNLSPNHRGFEFNDFVIPLEGETVITKHVNSAFIGTNLKQLLDQKDIASVVIIGLTTNHCVSTTTRMAGNYGYATYLIEDATATFERVGLNGETYDAELMHQTALASLNEEFATVKNSKDLLQAL